MKEAEAEAAIRSLAKDFRDTLPQGDCNPPSFTKFISWLAKNSLSKYLDFRSLTGARYDAELWFDDELNQNWRR
jgi:hypothetical protein